MPIRKRNFTPELRFRTSRSSGAGGQHVNTTETKVELIFDVKRSALLSAPEKEIILHQLASFINADGELLLSASRSRSQSANKQLVIKRFYDLLEKALKKQKKRIATKMPAAVKEIIRKNKKLHSEKKRERSYKPRDGYGR